MPNRSLIDIAIKTNGLVLKAQARLFLGRCKALKIEIIIVGIL